jgi:hypothetical protein
VVNVIDSHPVEWAQENDTGVVDQDVKAAEEVGTCLDRGGDGSRVGAVGPDSDGSTAERLDAGDDVTGLLLRRGVGQDHIGPLLCESQRDGGTDASARSRHQRGPALECGHVHLNSVGIDTEYPGCSFTPPNSVSIDREGGAMSPRGRPRSFDRGVALERAMFLF